MRRLTDYLKPMVPAGKVFALMTMAMLCGNVRAQEVFGEPNVWFFQLTTYDFENKWAVGNELHFRSDDYLNTPQQTLIRPYVTYHRSDALAFSGGYTYITTYPYGAYPLPDNLPEHNIWEQVELKQTLGKARVLHRYRLEQRWIGNLIQNAEETGFTIDGYDLHHRFRYRITALVDLKGKWFLHFFDELFIRSGEDVKLVGFDRNWIYGGVGYQVNDKLNLQLAYLYQYGRRSAELFEEHHTLQVSAVVTLGK